MLLILCHQRLTFWSRGKKLLPLLTGLRPLRHELFPNFCHEVSRGATKVVEKGEYTKQGQVTWVLQPVKLPRRYQWQLKPWEEGLWHHYFLTALDTHRTGSLTPVSGQCGSDPGSQANLCHSGSAHATSKREVSVKHLLQRLPPIFLHPNLSACMCLLTVSTLPDTPEFNVPTHEEKL